MTVARQLLESAPRVYFEAVDGKDMERTLAFLADDATFAIPTARLTFRARDEIRSMFESFFADHATIRHDITSLVVDEARGRAATEQSCPHVRRDGSVDHVIACNDFDFAADGRFARASVWIDAASPLRR